MRIVISFNQLVGLGGTETYVLTVAGALERLGHDVVIHAHQTGPAADLAGEHGTRVIEHESDLPARCDVVLAQDAATAYTMARRYPRAARVVVAHSTAFPLQTPPQLEHTCQAVVALNDRLRRQVEQLAWHPRVVRLRQPVDLQRFCFRATNADQRRPPRVLWLTNYPGGARQAILGDACRRVGFELKRIGAPTVTTATPEHEIAQAEIVVSLGRGVLEAMACGRAAYVFGIAGGDGWVTAASYPELEADGFTGRANGRSIGMDRLVEDLESWSERLGETGRDLACAHHDADRHAVELLELFEQLETPPAEPPSVAQELARLVRLEWDARTHARSAVSEAAKAWAEVATLREQQARTEARHGELERRLADLRATRRYRLACLIASPLDRLRARRDRARRSR